MSLVLNNRAQFVAIRGIRGLCGTGALGKSLLYYKMDLDLLDCLGRVKLVL